MEKEVKSPVARIGTFSLFSVYSRDSGNVWRCRASNVSIKYISRVLIDLGVRFLPSCNGRNGDQFKSVSSILGNGK